MRIILTILFVLMLSYISLAISRNAIFGSEFALWSDASEKSPMKARVHNELGEILISMGSLEQALSEKQKAIALQPNNPIMLGGLGYIYYKNKLYDDAIKYTKKALEIDPNFLKALNLLGAIYIAQGNFNLAYETLQKALSAYPNSSILHYNISLLLSKMGRSTEALTERRRGLEIDPYLSSETKGN